jgi:phage terminase large subunit-like protein
VKLACERQRRDRKREGQPGFPFRFDENLAGRICRFTESLPHIKGPLAGERIRLEGWQCFILTTTFGWVHDRGPKEGKRRFRRVYTEVPRGNAKSTLSSGVGLYCLGADGEGGAEVYSAATTRDQARIVFRDAQHMARRAPDLMARLGVSVEAHNINVLASASKFEALSAEADTLDGKNIHLAIVDELHAHKTRDVYDVIETGTGKRDQSLLWCITTAGSDRAGICYEVRTYLTKILDGLAEDESFFGLIYTIDDGDEWHEEASWKKANPNWGVSVQPDVVAQLASKAMHMPAAQNNFKTKHLDVWVSADHAWMDMRAWERCADKDLKIEQFAGKPCFVGLDLATKSDIAAKLRIFPDDRAGVRHYTIFGTYYLPEEAAGDGRNSQYSGWEIEGRLITTPGDVLDFGRIEDDLKDDCREFQIKEIAHDPWQAMDLAQRLMKENAPMVEVRNTVAQFSAPMKEIDALTRQGRLHHDGDPVLAWMISNVVAHLDNKENIYPRKERPEQKIDGVVALIMALSRAMVFQSDASIYATRGIIRL